MIESANVFTCTSSRFCANCMLQEFLVFLLLVSTFKEPVKIVLGRHRQVCKRKNKKKIVEVEDSFYYVPILQSLQQQLLSPRVFQMVMNAEVQPRQEDVTTLTDFSCGRLFNEHPLFSNDERAIKLLLYYDDVNVCKDRKSVV